jgi:hypothetical protein
MVVFVFVKKKTLWEILGGKSVRERLDIAEIRFVADSVCACVNHTWCVGKIVNKKISHAKFK